MAGLIIPSDICSVLHIKLVNVPEEGRSYVDVYALLKGGVIAVFFWEENF